MGYLTCTEKLLDLEFNQEVKSRGYLKFYPKKGYGKPHFRPIVKIFNERYVLKIKYTQLLCFFNFIRNKDHLKELSRKIFKAARQNCITKTTNLYLNWKNYCEQVKEKEIFCAKVDVIDAFGNIDISTQ